jgi:wobble nucleotide-excising tRNase
MSGNINKIQTIKRMAVFHDFKWDSSIRDSDNNIADFKKINILYGRNYSGKTILSRIFRALETGVVSDKYENPEFGLLLEDSKTVTQDSLRAHGHTVRVFNEDFVKENLRFIIDDEHSINSFAILGDDNNKIEEEIKIHESGLGSEEEATGLYGKLKDADSTYISAKKHFEDANSGLENKLRDKANKAGTGIKHNKTFGDANYNITKIKNDIKTVTAESYKPLTQEQIDQYHHLLKEEAKTTIPELNSFNLKFESFANKTQELVEKKIKVSDPIQVLLNDAALNAWVKTGRDLHEGKRKRCAFCNGEIDDSLWDKLNKHFNKESEELEAEIDKLLQQIEAEKKRIPSLIKINKSDFYSSFQSELDQLKTSFESTVKDYCSSLNTIVEQLQLRKKDIFNPATFNEPQNLTQELNSIRDRHEDLRNRSNHFTNSLSAKQSEARASLRLHEVHTFMVDIKYSIECEAIEKLKAEFEKAEDARKSAQDLVIQKKQDIAALKAQLKDESKGADRVNELLNNFFGHQSLSLKAIENSGNGQEKTGYRFEVTRNDKKAYHLSEGECSLIAFCYFMAKLEDVETKGNQPIIWIDDPVSSLDANHIFFVYSLINSEIVKPIEIEENGQKVKKERYKQLFISTHNLDFLKYLKRLPGARNKKTSQYFIIQRNSNTSIIQLMPGYLKDYVTEFNYLFHQIYKCANADITADGSHDCFYNFGNNARKFLEAFLYYKYPNAKSHDDKLLRFFGDDALSSSLTDRINNEYSHLAGVFERSLMPIDVPEMKTAAEFILKKIKEKDIDQYNALLQSIGEQPEAIPSEESEMTSVAAGSAS